MQNQYIKHGQYDSINSSNVAFSIFWTPVFALIFLFVISRNLTDTKILPF